MTASDDGGSAPCDGKLQRRALTSERPSRFVAAADFISTSLIAHQANQPEQFTSDSLATEPAPMMWLWHSVRVCVLEREREREQVQMLSDVIVTAAARSYELRI